MRVAITGATGGLGRSLAEFLLEQKVEVIALGRNLEAGADLQKKGAQFLPGEITDIAYLERNFAGADAVVHSAGLASPWGKWESFESVNVKGTESTLAAARAKNIKKIIHLSTPSVYFSGEPRENLSEESELPEPQSFYAKSKIMADQLVIQEAGRRPDASFVLLRPRAIFGPYDKTILPRMLKIMKKGFFPLPGGGEALVDITAVQNVVHGIWLALESPNVFRGEIFNITNDEPMKVKDLVEVLADILQIKVRFIPLPLRLLTALGAASEFIATHLTKEEPALSRYSILSIGTTQTLSIAKARRKLGYQPIISVRDALEQLRLSPKGVALD